MISINKITIAVKLDVDGIPVTLDLFSKSIAEAIEQLQGLEETHPEQLGSEDDDDQSIYTEQE